MNDLKPAARYLSPIVIGGHNDHLKTSAIVCFVAALLIAIIVIVSSPTSAQDTAPTWEYAALAYEDGTAFAFTGDLAVNNKINKSLDTLSDDDKLNAIFALNIMGAEGWELLYQQGSPTIVYLFKRPLP